MADNVNITAGSGTTIATDEVDSRHFQLMKMVYGADGVATLVSTADPLPISDAGGSITVDGTVAVSGSVAVTGTFYQATQPVSGTFWQATQPVSNAGTFAVQAAQSGTWNIGTVTTVSAVTSITNALPAGTNAIGKLAANSGVDIGDVDVTTLGGIVPAYGSGAAGSTVLRVVSATDDPIVSAITSGVATALPAGTNTIGKVGGNTVVKDVTLSLDTSAYASGDVLADTQQVDAALRVSDGTGILQSMIVVDKDDQGAAFDVYFLSANVAMGTENAAPSISDANAANILGHVSVATTDYKDLGGVKVATFKGIGLPLKAVSGTDDIYVAVVNGTGTPTYTASGVVLRLGVLQD